MSHAGNDSGPAEMAVRDAYQMFLDTKQMEYTQETLRDYESRLRQFVEWCEGPGEMPTVGEISGYDIERFKLYRQGQNLAPATLKGQMAALRVFLKYLASIDAVDEALPHKVNVPQLEQADETSDVMLEADEARNLVEFFRSSRTQYATDCHVALELAWFTGARVGGLRALDVDDYLQDEQALSFRHRPPHTPLKKQADGERVVGLRPAVAEVVDVWLDERRPEKRDSEGRRALLASRQGRATTGTLQSWMYEATLPCQYRPCPHGKERDTCDWTQRKNASKCPSSRSPHQIRTGSITWQLNCGLSYEEVAERVNSDPDTLRRYYDKATEREKLEERRRERLDQLSFTDDDDDQ